MTGDQQFILQLALYSGIGFLAALAAFTAIGVAAFWRTASGAAKTFSFLVQRGNILQITAVVFIVSIAGVLCILGRIEGAATASLSSGVAGYVLGGLGKEREKEKQDD